MGYIDLNTIHNPTTNTSPPASYGDQIRENFEEIRRAGPIICTAATRPAAPVEGTTAYETDGDGYITYTGSQWQQMVVIGPWLPFVPVVKFGATVATVVSNSRYIRMGRLIIAKYAIRFTNLNGGAGNLSVSSPVSARLIPESNYAEPLGNAQFFDVSSGATILNAVACVNTTADWIARHAGTGVPWTQASMGGIAVAVGGSGVGDELWATTTMEAVS